jgi:hypothetical protein
MQSRVAFIGILLRVKKKKLPWMPAQQVDMRLMCLELGLKYGWSLGAGGAAR